ncbi:hypothetical protein EMMF5_006485 [Cystobasidiomycetes sp. EMM_F5]
MKAPAWLREGQYPPGGDIYTLLGLDPHSGWPFTSSPDPNEIEQDRLIALAEATSPFRVADGPSPPASLLAVSSPMTGENPVPVSNSTVLPARGPSSSPTTHLQAQVQGGTSLIDATPLHKRALSIASSGSLESSTGGSYSSATYESVRPLFWDPCKQGDEWNTDLADIGIAVRMCSDMDAVISNSEWKLSKSSGDLPGFVRSLTDLQIQAEKLGEELLNNLPLYYGVNGDPRIVTQHTLFCAQQAGLSLPSSFFSVVKYNHAGSKHHVGPNGTQHNIAFVDSDNCKGWVHVAGYPSVMTLQDNALYLAGPMKLTAAFNEAKRPTPQHKWYMAFYDAEPTKCFKMAAVSDLASLTAALNATTLSEAERTASILSWSRFDLLRNAAIQRFKELA